MSLQPLCWTVNDLGAVWTVFPEGGGNLMSPSTGWTALDISVDVQGNAWVTSSSSNPVPGGAVIMGLPAGTTDWIQVAAPAAAAKLVAGANGTLWTINTSGEVWYVNPNGTSESGGLISPSGVDFALDIAVAPDGTVWVVSTEIQDSGNLIQSWNPNTQVWSPIKPDASATAISVDPTTGMLWVVTYENEVWCIDPAKGSGSSQSSTGFAEDISVGPDGTVWITNMQASDGGAGVMWLAPGTQNWVAVPSPVAATRVAGAVQTS